jgi:hypothetical protein
VPFVIGRSKERSFILILLSMGAIAALMYLDAGLSGGSRTNPLIGYSVLAVQALVLVWLVRADDHNVAARVGEAAAVAPFALIFAWAKLR